MSTNPFYPKGKSTETELEWLRQKWPNPVVGDTFTDDELSSVIGVQKGSFRFRTVIEHWRKKLFRDRNLLIIRERNTCYKVASPVQRIDYGNDKIGSGVRAIRKAGKVARSTPKENLTPIAQMHQEHQIRFSAWTEEKLLIERRSTGIPALPGPVQEKQANVK